MYFESLGLYLTYSCNLKCRHCSQDGAVKREARMDKLLLQSVLAQAGGSGIKEIALSGGEPFLEPHLVDLAAETCRQQGIDCWVVTNGWWAKSQAMCYDKLADLEGITGVSVSWDPWHEEFIHVDKIRWIVGACKQLGKVVEVGGCFIKDAEENLKWMFDSIGRSTCEGIEVHNQPVLWRGAVTKNFEKCDLPRHELWRGGCRAAKNPVVLPNGDVFACCGGSQDIGGKGFLYLGDVSDEPLSEIKRRASSNSMIKAIRHFGPEVLLEGGMEADLKEVSSRAAYKQCDICKQIAISPQVRDHAERVSNSPQMREQLQAKEV